jgi:hypothetical protein
MSASPSKNAAMVFCGVVWVDGVEIAPGTESPYTHLSYLPENVAVEIIAKTAQKIQGIEWYYIELDSKGGQYQCSSEYVWVNAEAIR